LAAKTGASKTRTKSAAAVAPSTERLTAETLTAETLTAETLTAEAARTKVRTRETSPATTAECGATCAVTASAATRCRRTTSVGTTTVSAALGILSTTGLLAALRGLPLLRALLVLVVLRDLALLVLCGLLGRLARLRLCHLLAAGGLSFESNGTLRTIDCPVEEHVAALTGAARSGPTGTHAAACECRHTTHRSEPAACCAEFSASKSSAGPAAKSTTTPRTSTGRGPIAGTSSCAAAARSIGLLSLAVIFAGLIIAGGSQSVLQPAVNGTQLFQADLAIVIGIDALEELPADFFVFKKRAGKELFFAQGAVIVLVEALHELRRSQRRARIRLIRIRP
jgi:hypothetical protein